MKKVLLILIAAIVVLLSTCSDDSPASSNSISLSKTYTNEVEGFSFKYPGNWDIIDDPQIKIGIITLIESNYFANMNIQKDSADEYLFNYTKSDFKEELENTYDDVDISELSNIELDGIPAIKLTLTYLAEGDRYSSIQYFYNLYHDLYGITFISLLSNFDKYEPIFETIMDSYKITRSENASEVISATFGSTFTYLGIKYTIGDNWSFDGNMFKIPVNITNVSNANNSQTGYVQLWNPAGVTIFGGIWDVGEMRAGVSQNSHIYFQDHSDGDYVIELKDFNIEAFEQITGVIITLPITRSTINQSTIQNNTNINSNITEDEAYEYLERWLIERGIFDDVSIEDTWEEEFKGEGYYCYYLWKYTGNLGQSGTFARIYINKNTCQAYVYDENSQYLLPLDDWYNNNYGSIGIGTKNLYPGEILYKGSPAIWFSDYSYIINTLGEPLYGDFCNIGYDTYYYREYKDFDIFVNDVNDQIPVVMCRNLSEFEIDGIKMDKNRKELINIFGDPWSDDGIEGWTLAFGPINDDLLLIFTLPNSKDEAWRMTIMPTNVSFELYLSFADWLRFYK